MVTKLIPKNYHVLLMLSILTSISCENDFDNYGPPNGGINGVVYDETTDKPIPLPVQGSSGVLVSLYELDTDATVSIDFRAKQDGSFVNSRVFNGRYNVVVNGPFVSACEGEIEINGQTDLKLYATPLSRITASASVSENNGLTIDYNVDKTSTSFNISNVQLLWNFAPGVDTNTSNYAGVQSMDSQETGQYTFDLSTDNNFVRNKYKIKSNHNKIYVRVAATINQTVNYSKVMEVTVN